MTSDSNQARCANVDITRMLKQRNEKPIVKIYAFPTLVKKLDVT